MVDISGDLFSIICIVYDNVGKMTVIHIIKINIQLVILMTFLLCKLYICIQGGEDVITWTYCMNDILYYIIEHLKRTRSIFCHIK